MRPRLTHRDMAQGLQDRYEAFHDVEFSEDALRAAVTLSMRHTSDRRLPDAAIDLMDESASIRHARALFPTPPPATFTPLSATTHAGSFASAESSTASSTPTSLQASSAESPTVQLASAQALGAQSAYSGQHSNSPDPLRPLDSPLLQRDLLQGDGPVGSAASSAEATRGDRGGAADLGASASSEPDNAAFLGADGTVLGSRLDSCDAAAGTSAVPASEARAAAAGHDAAGHGDQATQQVTRVHSNQLSTSSNEKNDSAQVNNAVVQVTPAAVNPSQPALAPAVTPSEALLAGVDAWGSGLADDATRDTDNVDMSHVDRTMELGELRSRRVAVRQKLAARDPATLSSWIAGKQWGGAREAENQRLLEWCAATAMCSIQLKV